MHQVPLFCLLDKTFFGLSIADQKGVLGISEKDERSYLLLTYEREVVCLENIDENVECVEKSGKTMEVSFESTYPVEINLYLPQDSENQFRPNSYLEISRCEGDACQLCGIGISITDHSGKRVERFCSGAGRGSVIRFATDGKVVRFCNLTVYERRPQ